MRPWLGAPRAKEGDCRKAAPSDSTKRKQAPYLISAIRRGLNSTTPRLAGLSPPGNRFRAARTNHLTYIEASPIRSHLSKLITGFSGPSPRPRGAITPERSRRRATRRLHLTTSDCLSAVFEVDDGSSVDREGNPGHDEDDPATTR